MANEQEQAEETAEALRLFITGGDTGVGFALLKEAVKRGYKVTATTERGSTGATIIRGAGGLPVYPDTTRTGEVRSVMQMARPHIVIHLTSQVLNGPPQHALDYDAYRTRLIQSTESLAEAAGQLDVKRLIFAGSGLVYGNTGSSDPVTEAAAIHTDTILQEAYADAEAMILDGGVAGYVLRCGILYGGHSPAMDGLVNDIRKGKGLPHGKGVVSWLHQDDLIDAILRLAERDTADDDVATIYNLADDDFMSHDAFTAELVAELGLPEATYRSGFLAPFLENERQSRILQQTTRVSSAKARDELGWSPEFTRKAPGIGRMLMRWRAESASPPPTDEAPQSTGTEMVST